MTMGRFSFNTFLRIGLFITFAALAGCSTPDSNSDKKKLTGKEKRIKAEVMIHAQALRGSPLEFTTATIPRDSGNTYQVEKWPMVTTSELLAAELVEKKYGLFQIKLQFDSHGTRMLENYTATNPGKALVIGVMFQKILKKKEEVRWLAAPKINSSIRDGVLSFTPDADREESESIVMGLNNTVRKNNSSFFGL